MDISYLVFLVIVATLIVIGAFLIIIRKLVKGNEIELLYESQISWEETKCPRCQVPMESGYSMAGRGVIWRERSAKKPGTFSTIASVLENTMSINMPPALNISWRCKSCKLIVLDNSKMVKVKNA